MKYKNWFDHEIGSLNDPKIASIMMSVGVIGVGIYWCLVETMYQNGGKLLIKDIENFAYILRIEPALIEKVLETKAFEKDERSFWTTGVLKRIQEREESSKEFSEYGRKGGLRSGESRKIKAEASKNKALASSNEALASKIEANPKGVEATYIHTYIQTNNNTLVECVFTHFCTKLNKRLQITPERRKLIEQRLKEGRTVEEMNKAIDNFSKDDWPERRKYCDLIYAIGTRNKINNLDKWLSNVPEKKWDI